MQKKNKNTLAEPLPELSKIDTDETLKKYIEYLIDLNKEIIILESAANVTKELIEESSPEQYTKKIQKIVQVCIKYAQKGMERLSDIVTRMAELSRIEAQI